MMASVDEVNRHCRVSPHEQTLLLSPQAPIVLLSCDKSQSNITETVAHNNNYLGVMLPYSPLHHILMRYSGRPLVMTSGNLSEEPICRDNTEALQKLAPLPIILFFTTVIFTPAMMTAYIM
jgi:hydrogenase maturation protein HypF